jgi:transposase
MQVFGLPRHVIRAGALASRIAATSLSYEAALRMDAVRRWTAARKAGFSADAAAIAVGVSRATLYRWARRCEPKSRRPRRVCGPQWSPALAQAVEELRADNPMWGKKKLAWLLRREGIVVSASTVGRILKGLVARGIVTPVPTLRRKPGGRRFRLIGQNRHARRLPGVADRATTALTASFLDKVLADMPFPVSGIRRLRVHGRFRTSLPRQAPRPLRPAAQTAPAQRSRRALQRIMALRVLRRPRSAPSDRGPPALRRCLRIPLQPS